MFYVALVHREGRHWLAEFPDAPGCQTTAKSRDALLSRAEEALAGWLEANLVSGMAPHRPRSRSAAPNGRELWKIRVEAPLAVAVQIRWARQDLGLTQKQLAERAGVSQQQIAKLENPDENPTIKTIAKVSAALGAQLDVSLTSAA
jgi:DNA-binding XRE family transcriptional regulator/predicted RNase H-like HicB family nuclease